MPTLFDLRLRLYSADGTRGRVLKTLSIGFRGVLSDMTTVQAQVSEKVAGALPDWFIAAVEYLDDGVWEEAENGRLIFSADETDAADVAEVKSVTGKQLIPWLLQRNRIPFSATMKDGKRPFTGTPGLIAANPFIEGQNRGWAPHVTWDFSKTKTSADADWEDTVENAFPVGTSGWDMVRWVVDTGHAEFSTTGMVAHLWNAGHGSDLSETVRISQKASRAPIKRSIDDVLTKVTVQGAGMVHASADVASDLGLGTLEGWVQSPGIGQTASALTSAKRVVAESADIKRELSITHGVTAGPLPFIDYQLGDIVSARYKGGWTALRVVELVVQKDAGGKIEVTAVLGSRFKSPMGRLAARPGAGVSGASTAPGDGVPSPIDTREPKAPTGVTVTATGEWSDSGLPIAEVEVSWTAVTDATTDEPLTVVEYEVQLRLSTESAPHRVTATAETSVPLHNQPAGKTILVSVRARSAAGVWSEFSDETTKALPTPTSVLDAPSDPVLTQHLGVVSARWDGLLDSAAPPAQFRYVVTETSSTETGTYGPAAPNMSHAGAVTLSGPVAGDTVWVRFVAVDTRNVSSAPSTPQSITVDGVTLADLDASVQAVIDAVDDAAAAAQSSADDAASAASTAQSTADSAVSDAATAQAAAESAATDAATAQSAAESAADDAAEAAGIAEGKGVVLFQTSTPGSDYENALTLWIDTTSGANTPKRWSGSDWSAVTDKAATDAADAAATAASAASDAQDAADAAASDAATAQSTADTAVTNAATAQATAEAAASAAAAAQSAADTAQSTADGKNKVIFSTANASGTSYTAGDLWFKRSGAVIIAQWEFTTSWQSRTLDNAVIANLDAGKITTGFLDVANRVAAGAIVTEKLAAGAVTAAKAAVGLLEAMQIQLGQRNPFGQASDRVPSPVTDSAWWGQILDGTVELLTPPSGLDFNLAAASSGGLVLSPSSSADARCWVTARLPVPSARALNVAFLADNSALVTAQNLNANPHPGLVSSGFTVLGHGGGGNTCTLTFPTSGGRVGSGYMRIATSAVNTGPAQVFAGPASDVSPSTAITIGFWAYTSDAAMIRAQAVTYTGAGGTGTAANVFGNEVAVPANTWTWVSHSFTTSGTVHSLRNVVYIATGYTASGRTFDIDLVSIGAGAGADFSGNVDSAGPNKYSWDGTPGDSTSTRTTVTAGARVCTWDAGGTVTTSDPLWSGEVWPVPDDAVDYAVHLFWPEDGAATTFSMAHVFEAIGNAGDGQYVRITPQGFEAVDAGGGVSTRLGTWNDNVLSIDQFNESGQSIPQARINTDGIISGNQVETGGDYLISGVPIVGDSDEFRVNGVPLDVPILERMPLGQVFSTGLGTDGSAWGEQYMQITGSTAYQAVGAAKLQLNDGRRYRVSMDAPIRCRWQSSPVNTSVLWLEVWIGDTQQVLTSPNGVMRRWRLLDGNIPASTFMIYPISPSKPFEPVSDANGFSYMLTRIVRVSSSTSYLIETIGGGDENNEPTLTIEDVGSASVDPYVSTTKLRTTSGTPSTPGSTTTIQVACSFSQSWGSTPSAIYTASGDKFADGRMLHQGQPGRSKMAIFGWPDLDIVGKQLLAARVLMRPRFISKSTGATVQFGTSAYTSPPAISKPAVANRWDVHTANPGSPRWFKIPLDLFSGLADDIAAGTIRSLTLGESSGGSEDNNIIFDGFYPTNALGAAQPPIFEFTYQV